MAKKQPMRQRLKKKKALSEGAGVGPSDKGSSSMPGKDKPVLDGSGEATAGAGTSRRIQRHAARTVRFLEKLQSTQAALAVKEGGVRKGSKERRKKSRMKGLAPALVSQAGADGELGVGLGTLAEALGGALPNEQGLTKAGPAITPKARSRLLVQEGAQLRAVLANPAFQADPFSAIHEHLTNALPGLASSLPLGAASQLEPSRAHSDRTQPHGPARRKGPPVGRLAQGRRRA